MREAGVHVSILATIFNLQLQEETESYSWETDARTGESKSRHDDRASDKTGATGHREEAHRQ